MKVALALYEHGRWGKNQKRYHHLGFLEHVLFRKIWKKGIEKIIREYLHLSLLWGTVQHTIDNVFVWLQQKDDAPNNPKFYLFEKNMSFSLKNLKHAWASPHVVIQDLGVSHAPSSVRWTMAPSCVIYLFLLLFFYCIVQSALVAAKKVHHWMISLALYWRRRRNLRGKC